MLSDEVTNGEGDCTPRNYGMTENTASRIAIGDRYSLKLFL